VTVLALPESTPELFARRSTLHISSLPSHLDTDSEVWGLDQTTWELMWAGEAAMRKSIPALRQSGYERISDLPRIQQNYREKAFVMIPRLTYTPAHAWCATTPVNTCRLCAKNAYGLVYARLFNCAAASLPWKLLRTYLESCANIVQAIVYCPPSRPPSCWQSVERCCSLKKSVQIHASS